MTGPDPADAEPGDAPTPDRDVAGAGVEHRPLAEMGLQLGCADAGHGFGQ
mgnify:CR=1 FL=1